MSALPLEREQNPSPFALPVLGRVADQRWPVFPQTPRPSKDHTAWKKCAGISKIECLLDLLGKGAWFSLLTAEVSYHGAYIQKAGTYFLLPFFFSYHSSFSHVPASEKPNHLLVGLRWAKCVSGLLRLDSRGISSLFAERHGSTWSSTNQAAASCGPPSSLSILCLYNRKIMDSEFIEKTFQMVPPTGASPLKLIQIELAFKFYKQKNLPCQFMTMLTYMSIAFVLERVVL